jgi:hypothetical protein
MGGPGKMIGKLINKATEEGVIKKVEPKLKTPEEGEKMSNTEEGNEAAAALLNKRKGRRKTIMTSASGLNEEEEIKKKTLLG